MNNSKRYREINLDRRTDYIYDDIVINRSKMALSETYSNIRHLNQNVTSNGVEEKYPRWRLDCYNKDSCSSESPYTVVMKLFG